MQTRSKRAATTTTNLDYDSFAAETSNWNSRRHVLTNSSSSVAVSAKVKKRKTLALEEQPLTIHPQPQVEIIVPPVAAEAVAHPILFVDQEETLFDDSSLEALITSTPSFKASTSASSSVSLSATAAAAATLNSYEQQLERNFDPILPLSSYQEKFALFVQCFLKVQDEYNTIIDLINATAKRAEELKQRVNHLCFYFNYSSNKSSDENDNDNDDDEEVETIQQKKRKRNRVLYELRDIQTLSSSMQNDYTSLKHRLKYKYLVVLDEFCTCFKAWEEKHSSSSPTSGGATNHTTTATAINAAAPLDHNQ